ncbi:MAG: COX15/CtaA family protein [Actinomycetota bacterium]
MARLPARLRAPISPEAYRRITLVALFFLGAIIVTGAAVRLTGSGMGCPTWPSCEDGSLAPRGATGHHGWIEFLNRLVTGVVSVAVALAVLGAHRRRPYRRDLTRWAWGLVAGVFAQALLGGLVVILHVAPIAVAGHYLLSAVLMWNGVVLHHRAGQPDDAPAPDAGRPSGPLLARSRAMVVLAGAVLVTGALVTGAGPHGRDEAADRLDLAVVTVARIHSVTVWLFLAVALVVLVAAERAAAPSEVRGAGRVLLGLVVAQGGLGYLQYFTGVPEILVGGHVLGSVLVWVAALRFHLLLAGSPAVAAATEGRPTADRSPVAGALT